MVDESKCSFEELSLNCDIMLPIFKMLNFKDQLRFSHASATLQHIFELFLWPGNYKNLNILGSTEIDYTVTNGEKFQFLSDEEMKEFLHYYAYQTQKLVVTQYGEFEGLKYFENLISLELDEVIFSTEIFEELAKTVLSNLEYLRIYIVYPLEIESVLPLNNLKTLHLYYQYGICNELLWKVLNLPKLEFLTLSTDIVGKDVLIDSQKPCSSQLMKLEMPTILESRQWRQCFFIEHFFENLVSLTLFSENLRLETLNMIAVTCKKLEIYAIYNSTFISIEDFILPKNVLELSIKRCEGLTRTNLRQILTETGITKFYTSGTTYSGDFEDFPLSPLIVTFHMFDSISWHKSENYKTFLTNPNLEDLRCGPLLNDGVLSSHNKLEKLHLNTTIPLGPLQLLTQLQKLIIEWLPAFSTIIDLLQHQSLKDLCMLKVPPTIFDAILPADLKTNVIRFETHFISYAGRLDFWLDLFKSTSMELIFQTEDKDKDRFVKQLIIHEKFPKGLKKIQLFGFPVECKTLRTNYYNDMKMFGNYSYCTMDPNIMLSLNT